MGEITQDQNQAISSRIAGETEIVAIGIPEPADEVVVSTGKGADLSKVKTLNEVVQDMKNIMPQPKTRAKRTVKPVTSGKVVDAQELIAKMKAKIEAIQYIDGIQIPDIATSADKAVRDVLVGFQKEIETTKAMAITAIQQL